MTPLVPDVLAPGLDLVLCGTAPSPASYRQRAYYANLWRTWQMSDHLPMWVQLKVDFTEDYLGSLKPGHEPLADLSEVRDA